MSPFRRLTIVVVTVCALTAGGAVATPALAAPAVEPAAECTAQPGISAMTYNGQCIRHVVPAPAVTATWPAGSVVPPGVQPARQLTDGEQYQYWITPETRIVHYVLPDGRIAVYAPKGAVIPEPGSDGITAPWTPPLGWTMAGDGRVEVEWRTPAGDGGSPITGYTVTANPGGRTCTTTGALACTVTGLANGTQHTFTVAASNVRGTGPASAPSGAVTPLPLPGAPTGVTAVRTGTTVTVSWTPHRTASADRVDGYAAQAGPDAGSCSTTGATTCVISWLPPGPHSFTVVASNAMGSGPASAPSTPVVALGYHEGYVERVYADLLRRTPDAAGLSDWARALERGAPYADVANAITASAEFRGRLVDDAYGRFLGRAPDAAGRGSWLTAMGNGMHIEQLGAGFVASPEFYARAGNDPRRWVTDLYRTVLERESTAAEVDGWQGVLARGAQRQDIALGFLYSTEHLTTVVDGHYRRLLGRGIDPEGARSWVAAIQAGARDEQIVAGLVASEEYRARI